MALRVGASKATVPIAEELIPQEEPLELPEEDLMSELPPDLGMEPEMGGGVVDKSIAVYRTPDQGPFMCGNCMHFAGQEQGTCDIVSGPIDAEGVCNLFTSGSEQPAQEPMPENEPYPVEEPNEEAPVTPTLDEY